MSGIIMGILLGALSGYLAGKIMGAEGGFLHNVILGIIGGFVGSLLLGLIGLGSRGMLGDVVVAVIGACVFIMVGRKFFR